MSKIELRLSDVDPPLPEPKRTIYRDIVNLPNPVKLGLTIRYFNHDDVTLYFQITGSGPGYTFGTVNLGSLASGANAFRNLDEFASRAKPSASDLPNGEMEENITLILKAYTDSGYTNLKWTFERTVTVHWINSADPAWTVDVLNNFDDGTVQGWELLTGSGSINVATDYVLSTPYSLKVEMTTTATGCTYPFDHTFGKSISTPNKSKIFAIIDLRTDGRTDWGINNIQILKDDNTLIFIGKPWEECTYQNIVPANKWMRIVVPLPANWNGYLKIFTEKNCSGGTPQYWHIWLDDFKIISK